MTGDLGRLDGPVLLFGGPYSNRQATEALIAEAGRLGIPASRAICTGDVVAYAAAPQATVDRLRAWGCAVVMGNCEEALAADAGDCGCGFAAGSQCAALSDAWYRYSVAALDAEAKRWMAALPRTIDFVLGGRRLHCVHGSVTRINRFVFASEQSAIDAELAACDADGVIGGHCGLPFTAIRGGRLWHNPGAIGLPAHDGTPRVWFSLLVPQDDGLRIEHRPLTYDHMGAAAAMRRAGLPRGYADALETGRWPSEDVLPPVERAGAGRPLAPTTLLWTTPARVAA